MGIVDLVFSSLFGGGRNVVKDTVEVFRENADAQGARVTQLQNSALDQYGAEFVLERQGWFDRFMDGVNRLPRPALALGTLGLFVSAMVAPLWFSERMQGIALVPEPLWWLLGVIVSFYFGARHQIKAQQFQREIVASVAAAPQVVENIATLREMRKEGETPSDVHVADTGSDADLSISSVAPDANAALDDWRRMRRAA